MADKTIHIKADFSGDQPDDNGSDLKDMLAKAEAIAEREAKLFTFVADTMGATGTPEDFAKKKGQRGRPPKEEPVQEDTVEEVDDELTKLIKTLKYAQKVVQAFNGVNGKVTKSLAAVNRTLQLAQNSNSKWVTKLAKGTAFVVGKLGKLGKIAGITAVSLTAAAIALVISGKILSGIINSLKEVVGKFSVATKIAEANNHIMMMQAQMNAANRVGAEVASLERSRGEIERSLQELWVNITDFFSPAIKFLADLFLLVSTILNYMLGWANKVTEFMSSVVAPAFKVLKELPLLGPLFDRMEDWFVDQEMDKAKDVNKLHKLVEDLGALDSLTISDDLKKNFQKKGFL